jgi:hypothetical protein
MVLARVSALRQFTILNPATVDERLANIAELTALADRLDDPSLRVFSRWWRAVATLQAADRGEVDVCVDEACRLSRRRAAPRVGARRPRGAGAVRHRRQLRHHPHRRGARCRGPGLRPHRRLVEIKRTYEPTNLFRLNNNIDPQA